MFALLFTLCISMSADIPEPTLWPTLKPTQEDTRGLIDEFENICNNETLYTSDKTLSVICQLLDDFKEYSKDTDDDSKIGSIISLCFEVLSFLIGVFGVGYFVYLRCKPRFEDNIDKPNEDVELEIQKI